MANCLVNRTAQAEQNAPSFLPNQQSNLNKRLFAEGILWGCGFRIVACAL